MFTKYRSSGAAMTFSVHHFILITMAIQGTLGSSRPMQFREKVFLYIAYLEHYIVAAIFFIVAWEKKEWKDIKNQEKLQHQLLYYLVLVPLTSSLFCGAVKYFDDTKNKSMTKAFLGLMIIVAINLVAFIILMFKFESVLFALFIVGISAFVFFMAVQFTLFHKNNFQLSKIWKAIDFIFAVVFALAVLIGLGKRDDIENFGALSTKLLLIFILILVWLAFVSYTHYHQRLENPIYYSPWVMPIYKYHCAKNDVHPYYKTLILTGTLITILASWSLGVTFMIRPMSFGIGLTCVVECITIVVLLWANTYSVSKLQAVKNHVDDDIVKQAWL